MRRTGSSVGKRQEAEIMDEIEGKREVRAAVLQEHTTLFQRPRRSPCRRASNLRWQPN